MNAEAEALPKVDTRSLLQQHQQLEAAKSAHIKALRQEREDIEKKYKERSEAIASELKALGYHKPRAARQPKVAEQKL